MDRFKTLRRVNTQAPPDDDGASSNGDAAAPAAAADVPTPPPKPAARPDMELFMGMKIRRRAALQRPCRGDYIGVPADPYLTKILTKQGDGEVLFADRIMKFTGSGKMKRRILLITDFAIYIIDPEADILKRRIALAAVDKLCLSNLSDNFFAIIVPSEYDCLMASTRKIEIVSVLLEATKSTSEYELEVVTANRFEYNAASDLVKEVHFEEAEGSGGKASSAPVSYYVHLKPRNHHPAGPRDRNGDRDGPGA